MDTPKITQQLINYRTNNLTFEERTVVEKNLSESMEWQTALKELDFLEELMATTSVFKPSKNSKLRFEALLAQEKQDASIVSVNKNRTNSSINLRQFLQVAAALTLLIMGVGIGSQWKNNQVQQTEIATLKAEMLEQKKLLALSLLEQTSASSRIKGVNISLKEAKMDDQILDALIARMNVDKNINVRMKAVEGLAQFGSKKKVITALIKALNGQQSPEVQIAIIDVLTDLKVKDAYPQFQEILQNDKTIDAVKNKAASGLEALL